jgi:DNA-binding XRE family transcriptional regulator
MRVQALRYAAAVEWTPERIRLFREVGLCQSQEGFARTLGFAKRTIGNAERGTHPPSLALRRGLDDALAGASGAQRERFLAAVAAEGRGVVSVAGGLTPVVESVELLRRIEASELGPATVEQMQELVERLGGEYFAVPPAQFREAVLSWRRYVARLLEGRLTLGERRELYAVAGWLSGLVAEASLALGEEAGPHCTTALALAQQVGDARLAGWVRGTQAQIALYAGDPREAVAFAQAGRLVAPAGSAALVRSCTQQARASARIGDYGGTQIALDAAQDAWHILSQPLARSIYSFGTSYLPYCAATAFVWLGDPRNAIRSAREAIEATNGTPEAPGGRVISRIDMAIALAQDFEAEEASAIGLQALDVYAQRMTLTVRKRIEELLAALHRFTEPCVVELRERWRWISR